MTASIRVVDSQRRPVASGETGELVVSADTMFSGYFNRPDKTSEVLVNGEYFTGDIGRIDAAGYIYVTDRATDMIITGGMNVYPAEVEAYLAQLTQIAEVAVVGTPDAKWGETVTAVVVLKNGQTISQEDILRHVKTGLASYKKPTQIVFAESLPRNAGMKVQKHILKASLKEGKL
jgi:long-chain acyl-CoA synthetase